MSTDGILCVDNGPTGDGVLDPRSPPHEPSDSFTYDPRDPLMTLYGSNAHDEPHDLRVLDHRRDVLVYQTPPLGRGIEVSGYPTVTLFASSSASDTDFIVKLVDVHPEEILVGIWARSRASVSYEGTVLKPKELLTGIIQGGASPRGALAYALGW